MAHRQENAANKTEVTSPNANPRTATNSRSFEPKGGNQPPQVGQNSPNLQNLNLPLQFKTITLIRAEALKPYLGQF